MTNRPPNRTLSFIFMCFFALIAPFAVNAQGDVPGLLQTAEYNIGFDCPVSATLNPDQTIIWVLMDNCGHGDFNLLGFNIADGSPVQADSKNFADILAPLDNMWLYSDTKPLAFTPDGAVDVRYNDADTYDALNLRLTLTGDKPAATDLTLLTNDTIQKLIPGYAGYAETTTYSPDHTLAAVPDTSAFHIIDLKTGSEIIQFEVQPTTDYSRASFSEDNQTLYLSTLKNVDDAQDNTSDITFYSLPDGELLSAYRVPSSLNSVSPNGSWAVGYVGGQFDAGLVVTNLEMGNTTPTFFVNEPPHPVTECLNTGKKLSGLDYKTRGELPVRDIVWLPDSKGFFTVNSYLGDGAAGGNICIFNYSRLRQYKLGFRSS